MLASCKIRSGLDSIFRHSGGWKLIRCLRLVAAKAKKTNCVKGVWDLVWSGETQRSVFVCGLVCVVDGLSWFYSTDSVV